MKTVRTSYFDLNKVAQMTPQQQTAQGIGRAFEGMGAGISNAAQAKALEYAKRIIAGEDRNQVLQGIAPNLAALVDTKIKEIQSGGNQQNSQAGPSNPGVMTFNGIMKQYPDIAKSYQVVSSGEKTKRILRYQLEQLGINWQSMPEFIELLG